VDALDRIEPVARGLVSEVDAVLAEYGAPGDHPLWRLLMVMGAMPGEAVAGVGALRPDALREAGSRTRQRADHYRTAVSAATSAAPGAVWSGRAWGGHAAEMFASRAVATLAHVSDGPDSMAGRLDATASYVDILADWAEQARCAMAHALAEVLSSAAVITLRSGNADGGDRAVGAGRVPGGPSAGPSMVRIRAAADIGAHVLAAAHQAQVDGAELHQRFAPVSEELTYYDPGRDASMGGLMMIDIRH
jgi:hypothetical protein